MAASNRPAPTHAQREQIGKTPDEAKCGAAPQVQMGVERPRRHFGTTRKPGKELINVNENFRGLI